MKSFMQLNISPYTFICDLPRDIFFNYRVDASVQETKQNIILNLFSLACIMNKLYKQISI